ncbi:MAG: GNA1162 family protein [Armatimonadota bacterium]
MKTLTRATLAAAVLMALAFSGCKEGGPGRQSSSLRPEVSPIRVAIVPFDSAGVSQENAARIVTEEVLTTLMSAGTFDVVEPGMVYSALADSGARNAWGLDTATMQKLEEKLGPVSCFIVGTVQEFGEVHVGSLSYPSISVSARVLDPQTGRVLWAGSCSRTGAETEKLFGMGAIHSSGRLARAVVQQLMLSVPRDQLVAALKAAPGQTSNSVTTPRPGAATAPAGPTGNEKFMDESGAVSEATLKGYLVDFDGLTKGAVTYRTHYFPIAETSYQGPGVMITVKLEDCGKKGTALARVKHEHPGETDTRFAGLPSYASTSAAQMSGAYHLDLAAGRFALFLTGPESKKADLQKLAQALLTAME